MAKSSFPKPVSEVVATLADIFRHQGKGELAELCESAHARFDETNYDNWNGGTYTWALRLVVPVPLFASIEPRLLALEKEIGEKLSQFGREYPNDRLGEVTITPISPTSVILGKQMTPSDVEVRRLWPDGMLRLFLSHLAVHKVAVSKLKDELKSRGVAAFVAHEDIEPSLEWRNEIELGLRSMHALAALLTLGFHESNWTDQEMGWALGRGVLVLPVRVGIDPYGFAGKYQGISGSLEQPAVLASSIVEVLLANNQTHGEMRRALVASFTNARSFQMAKSLRALVVQVQDFTDEEKEALRKACVNNEQVKGAFGVTEAIYRAFGKPTDVKTSDASDVSF